MEISRHLRRGPMRFEVRTEYMSAWNKLVNTRISLHHNMEGAFASVVEVLQRWGATEGAVKEGTKVSIVDCRDGGRIFSMEYLGFEPNLTSGGE